METASQIDPAIQAREDYIRSIECGAIARLQEWRDFAVKRLQHASEQSVLICVHLPGMRAIEIDTLQNCMMMRAWMHREYMFIAINCYGVLGNRYYLSRPIEMPEALVTEQEMRRAAKDATVWIDDDNEPLPLKKRKTKAKIPVELQLSKPLTAERARQYLAQQEAIPLPPEALRQAILEKAFPPKVNPAPLWWEIENENHRVKREEVIAMRNELRALLGTHNPT